jgi:hypothetical protein
VSGLRLLALLLHGLLGQLLSWKLIQPRYGAIPRRLRELQRGEIRRAASRAIEQSVSELIQNQFDERRAPDGTPWAPRKQPTGTWPLLEKSRKMRRSFKVMVSASQLKILNAAPYLKFHQEGTSRMVARPVLPGAGLTSEWTEYIDVAVEQALARTLE